MMVKSEAVQATADISTESADNDLLVEEIGRAHV